MKKFISILFALTLAITFTSGASAATKSASATLFANETSKSSVRVDVRQHLTFDVVNTGKYNISYKVFKNGVAVGGEKTVTPGKRISGKELSGGKDAQYSVRMYCKSSKGTGCTGATGLVGF